MRLARRIGLAFVVPLAFWASARADDPANGYAVVISEATRDDPQWAAVAQALVEKYNAEVVVYEGEVDESLTRLKALFPRFTCFVARPDEAGKEFVANVHQLTRRFDDDPYTDTSWGILTGYNADAALRIAKLREPLTVRRVAAGTEVALEMCEQGRWFSELEQGRMVVKQPGEPPEAVQGPADSTEALVDALREADLFVTSGHATEHDWQIGFRYRNGSFRCRDGRLFGRDTRGMNTSLIHPSPKCTWRWGIA